MEFIKLDQDLQLKVVKYLIQERIKTTSAILETYEAMTDLMDDNYKEIVMNSEDPYIRQNFMECQNASSSAKKQIRYMQSILNLPLLFLDANMLKGFYEMFGAEIELDDVIAHIQVDQFEP
jgi:hypothetical protein